MKPLYEISNEYLHALERIEIDEETGEIKDFPANLEAMPEIFEGKATNVVAFFRNLDAEADAIRQAEREMAERRKRIEKKSQLLKTYLLDNMKRCGFTKVKCPWFEVSVGKNPPSVDVTSEEEIPAMYKNVELVTKIDKIAIRNAIKEGVDVPGARMVSADKLNIK